MNYRLDKYGNKLSILGFGCMRFQRKAGGIDIEEAEKEIMAAYNAGVNYYDTAYIYPGSEAAVGEIFERNGIREKVYIATKLPHYLAKSIKDVDKIFNEELKRLRTTYVDYYLMHMLSDVETWERLKAMGIVEWIQEKQAAGVIRQIGFSYHGNTDGFCRLVDAYDWDFCQIQYNYMDEHSQAGRQGLMHANKKGLPVIIMEPLRGGKLAKDLPNEALELFHKHTPARTPVQWALRWLWNQPEVTVVLSGMNSMEQVYDNIDTASTVEVGEFTSEDEWMLSEVIDVLNSKIKVPCTGCSYCQPCPKGVNIPGCFAAYNMVATEGKITGMMEYMKNTTMRKTPTAASQCVECGLCEKHCPQHINIREELKRVRKEMETPIYRIASKVVRTFGKF